MPAFTRNIIALQITALIVILLLVVLAGGWGVVPAPVGDFTLFSIGGDPVVWYGWSFDAFMANFGL